MKIKVLSLVIIILAALLAASCGGTSGAGAPPVEMPAPVVGKITVGTPDANGKSTITGTPGAVTGNTIVLAVNERLESSTALWRITDTLIPSAHAQLADFLPMICEELGHWCTMAIEDGSFEMVVDAYIGDNIVVVIIDENGVWISDSVGFIIPSTNLALVACGAFGVDGTMTDLLNLDGDPVVLYEGSSISPSVIDVGGVLTIPVPGCFAKDLATVYVPGETFARLIMISSEDGIAWVVAWDGAHFVYAETFILDVAPLAIENIGEGDYAAIAYRRGNSFEVGRLSLIDGTISNETVIPPPPGAIVGGLLTMRAVGPFVNAGGTYLIAVLTTGEFAGANDTFLTFFDSATMSNISDNDDTVSLEAELGYDAGDISDAIFITNPLTSEVLFFMANHGLAMVHFRQIFGNNQPTLMGTNIGASSNLRLQNPTLISDVPAFAGLHPRKLASGTTGTFPVVYATSELNELWQFGNFLTAAVQSHLAGPVDGLVNPTLIAVDDNIKSILVGDDTLKQVFDLSADWMN